ncbi:MAG TPA: hypothetical protein PKG77_03565 [Phycisphaerae bacterium]|nr:hypothetical protein [Phycisphaerae bacterium]HQL72082.1 hypothetical protein [Phycisphaerae bacterium]
MARSRKRPGKREVERDLVRDLLVRNRDRLTEKLVHSVLNELAPRLPDLGEHLAHLAAYDNDARIWHMGAFLLFSALRGPYVADTIKNRVQESARPVLLGALRDPHVSDQRKYTLGPIHHLAGGEMSREEYEACFKDFEGTLHGVMENIFERISDQPESVERTLLDMGLLNGQGDANAQQSSAQSLLHICDHLRGRNDSAVAMLLATAVVAGAECRLGDNEMRHMVEMLASVRNERSAWCLGELANWPALGQWADLAGQYAQQMLSVGVRPRTHVLSELSHALASTVDASGSRSMLLFYRTGEGGMDAIVLLLNDRTGVRDAWAVFEDGCVVEEKWRADGPEGVEFAQVSLAYVREVVGDALALHREQDRLPPARLMLLRPYLGNEPIPLKRRKPNLGSYMLELLPVSPHLVEGSEDLAQAPVYANMGFAGDQAYQFLRENLPKRGRCRLAKAKLDLFAREVAALERSALLERMAANLEIESLAGRAVRPENRLAAGVWLGVTHDVVPFEKVGFIRALCRDAVERIGRNIRMGYQNQDEVNAAQMALDKELMDFEEEMSDDEDFEAPDDFLEEPPF